MPDMIRVAFCDDHPLMRGGLRRLLEVEPDIEVVGEAGDSPAAIRLARATLPDVFIIDIGLPGGSGIDATRTMVEANPDARVLILTQHDEVGYLRAALAAGATGYFVKDAAEAELLTAVRTVAGGRRYVYPTLAAALFEPARKRTPALPLDRLTEREREVLRLLALGYTNAESATELCLSVRTIEYYRAHIQQKLGVKSRAALARAAREAGLLND